MNEHSYSRRAATALVVTQDSLTAALIGSAIDLAGFRPEFPRPGEDLTAALHRTRPSHVLFDCEDSASRDETALGRTMMIGARLFFFGSARRLEDVQVLAASHQVKLIVLPDDITRLREILTRRPSPTPSRPPAD